jgi:hypothetical protein
MQIFRRHRFKQPNLSRDIDMTIQMKDLSVVQEIAVSEMSAVRGGIGSHGLSGGTVRSGATRGSERGAEHPVHLMLAEQAQKVRGTYTETYDKIDKAIRSTAAAATISAKATHPLRSLLLNSSRQVRYREGNQRSRATGGMAKISAPA